jgi:C2H2-type zinc finger
VVFACDECGDAFPTLSKLRQHKRAHHTGPKIVVINKHGRRLLAKPVQLDLNVGLL